MQPIKDLINKIKWDKKEDPSDYSLFYIDRITQDWKEIRLVDIDRLEGEFIIIKKDEGTEIPLHRIKVVKKKEEIVWRREL